MNLTRSEVCVANLAVEGLSSAEIAMRLFVSEGTIKQHLTSIYKKFGVKARAQFIVKYARFLWELSEQKKKADATAMELRRTAQYLEVREPKAPASETPNGKNLKADSDIPLLPRGFGQ